MPGTFGDLKSEIQDEIDDTTDEYVSQVERAILAAIRYCERSSFYFNEGRDFTFNTVADQSDYDSSDLADIPTLVRIQAAYWTDTGGTIYELGRIDPSEAELLITSGTAATGQPALWTYFDRKIRLYPIPSQAYEIRLQIGPYRLAPLSSDSDENAWLTEAWDMVKARAKYVIYKDVLKDATMAAEAAGDFQDQFKALKAETTRRLSMYEFVPSQF